MDELLKGYVTRTFNVQVADHLVDTFVADLGTLVCDDLF